MMTDHVRSCVKRCASFPVQVNQHTVFVELLEREPWLKSTKLVVKPDMLFGKRGKHDLLALNVDFAEAEAFIAARMGKQASAAPVRH